MAVRVTLDGIVLLEIAGQEVLVTTDPHAKAIAFRMLTNALAELADIDPMPIREAATGYSSADIVTVKQHAKSV